MLLRMLHWMARWPLRPLHGVGVALGWLVYSLSGTYRARVRTNADAVGLSVSARRRAVSHAGRMVGELPYLWLRPREAALGPRLVFSQGIEVIQQALDAGRGLVLMTPHLGAFEVTAQAYAERFGAAHPLTAMYRPARQAWLRDMQRTARDRPGLLTAPASLAGIRQMLRALRSGHTVGLLPDQVPPEGMGVWAPYFGRDAYTMTLAARLVQQTGAAAILMTCQRLPHGAGFEVRAERLQEPLPPPPTDARDEAQDRAHQVVCAAAINRAMETLVRRFPEQYLWGYNRYKTPRRLDSASAPPTSSATAEAA